jgi:membrane protease YdiL (CAAX protease family)
MSSPSFLNGPENPNARRPRSFGERAFLLKSGGLRPYVRVLLFVFCVLVIQLAIAGLFGEYGQRISFWQQLFWSSVVFALSFVALSWIFVRFIDRRDFSTLGLTLRGTWARELCVGLAFGTALQLFVLAILLATHSVHYSAAGGYTLHFWRLLGANVLLFAIAGTVEELAFRGYALKWLITSVGAPAALVTSAIIFGVAHGANPNATFFSTLNTALAGILLAVPYVRTRSMWMQIGVHWSWNLVLCTIVSLPVSGINFGPHLFITHDAGPRWLTGGNYGPEGGAVVTIVCVAGIAWLISTRRLRPSPSAEKELQ